MEEQLAPFDWTNGIHEWDNIWILYILPIKDLNNFLREQDIFHSNSLHFDIIAGMRDQNFFDFKASELLRIERKDLELGPLTLDCTVLVVEDVGGPAEDEHVELLVVFVEILLAVQSWIARLVYFEFVFHYVIYQKFVRL